jgi:hypothetical protein
MKVHATVAVDKGPAPPAPMTTLQVIDLTVRPEHRGLWRSRPAAGGEPAGLPSGGFASPLGFWLAPTPDLATTPAGTRTIRFRSPAATEGTPPPPPAPPGWRGRPPRVVRVKPAHTGDGDLFLAIGPDSAQVTATPAAWQSMAEPVLLATCLYWRFAAMDAEVDRLTESAHDDLDHATMPGPSTLRDRRLLESRARDVRALMLDLPHFEGPLTDPAPYCSSERAAQAFETLAEKLGLEEWCELIDERTEAIEDAYEALSEKLFEYRNFAWEAILEVLIVILLLAELAFMAFEAFTP